MKLLFLAAFLLFSGCTKPIAQESLTEPDGDCAIIDVEKKIEPEPDPISMPPVSVSAPQNVVDAVYQVLGVKGSLPPKEDLTIEAPGAKVTIHPGSTADYEFFDGAYLFSFNEPRPTVEASALGFKIHPPLLRLKLMPDNTGTATVKTAFGEVNRKFAVNWEVTPGSLAIADEKLPEVWCYGADDCEPCKKAKRDFETAKAIMPFKPNWGEKVPSWAEDGRPLFWWHISKDKPSQEDIQNTKQRTGYLNLKEFLERWKASRKD